MAQSRQFTCIVFCVTIMSYIIIQLLVIFVFRGISWVRQSISFWFSIYQISTIQTFNCLLFCLLLCLDCFLLCLLCFLLRICCNQYSLVFSLLLFCLAYFILCLFCILFSLDCLLLCLVCIPLWPCLLFIGLWLIGITEIFLPWISESLYVGMTLIMTCISKCI